MFVSLCLLQFIGALDGISLVLGSPLSHLTVGLGHGSLELGLGLLLLLVLLPQQLAVMAGRLKSVGKSILGLKQRRIFIINVFNRRVFIGGLDGNMYTVNLKLV